jgi:hypothetical protein
MTHDDFIKQQDIVCLDQKHKIGNWHLHKNLVIYIQRWTFNYSKSDFYFQDASEVNGIEIPFTVGIQILVQLQSMISCVHNEPISMNATFGINDVKFHLFTLIVFHAHYIGMSMALIMTCWKKCEDLVEWLTLLKVELLSYMPKWKQFFPCWWCPTRIACIVMILIFLPSLICLFKCFNVHDLDLC